MACAPAGPPDARTVESGPFVGGSLTDARQRAEREGKVVMIDSTSLVLQTPERAIIVPLSKMTRENVEVYYPEGQEDHLLPPVV